MHPFPDGVRVYCRNLEKNGTIQSSVVSGDASNPDNRLLDWTTYTVLIDGETEPVKVTQGDVQPLDSPTYIVAMTVNGNAHTAASGLAGVGQVDGISNHTLVVGEDGGPGGLGAPELRLRVLASTSEEAVNLVAGSAPDAVVRETIRAIKVVDAAP
jgi:hypothetical protein